LVGNWYVNLPHLLTISIFLPPSSTSVPPPLITMAVHSPWNVPPFTPSSPGGRVLFFPLFPCPCTDELLDLNQMVPGTAAERGPDMPASKMLMDLDEWGTERWGGSLDFLMYGIVVGVIEV